MQSKLLVNALLAALLCCDGVVGKGRKTEKKYKKLGRVERKCAAKIAPLREELNLPPSSVAENARLHEQIATNEREMEATLEAACTAVGARLDTVERKCVEVLDEQDCHELFHASCGGLFECGCSDLLTVDAAAEVGVDALLGGAEDCVPYAAGMAAQCGATIEMNCRGVFNMAGGCTAFAEVGSGEAMLSQLPPGAGPAPYWTVCAPYEAAIFAKCVVYNEQDCRDGFASAGGCATLNDGVPGDLSTACPMLVDIVAECPADDPVTEETCRDAFAAIATDMCGHMVGGIPAQMLTMGSMATCVPYVEKICFT